MLLLHVVFFSIIIILYYLILTFFTRWKVFQVKEKSPQDTKITCNPCLLSQLHLYEGNRNVKQLTTA